MEKFKLENSRIEALIINDKSGGTYTIFADAIHGPIVSDPDLDTAKAKFTEAFKLACAVRNFRYFNQAMKAQSENRKALAKKITTRVSDADIQFVEGPELETC